MNRSLLTIYIFVVLFTYVRTSVHPVVNIIAPPENTTVCKDSDVTINCGYRSARILPIAWLINGTVFTQRNLRDSPLYQMNNPFSPSTYSLTVFSIDGTTTFQCIVQSDPSITSTLGTVTVIGTYAHIIMYVCTCICKWMYVHCH